MEQSTVLHRITYTVIRYYDKIMSNQFTADVDALPDVHIGKCLHAIYGGLNLSKLFKFAYKHRGDLVAIPIFIALFSHKDYENELVIWTSALFLFFLGFTIRIWAQQHLHFRLKMKRICTTTGPYAYVRNPIYIGNTLICLGLIIASEQVWLVPFELLLCFIVFPLVVRHEEINLLAKYGDEYQAYLDKVPRWLPKFHNAGKPDISRNFLRLSVRAEIYNLLFLVPVIIREVVFKG